MSLRQDLGKSAASRTRDIPLAGRHDLFLELTRSRVKNRVCPTRSIFLRDSKLRLGAGNPFAFKDLREGLQPEVLSARAGACRIHENALSR